jgi:hypothetical protein
VTGFGAAAAPVLPPQAASSAGTHRNTRLTVKMSAANGMTQTGAARTQAFQPRDMFMVASSKYP